MLMRVVLPILLVAPTTPSYADDKGVTNIADGIASYRLSASFCHWANAKRINRVLNGEEIRGERDQNAFDAGVREGADRFHFLTKTPSGYCREVKSSRNEMTKFLEKQSK